MKRIVIIGGGITGTAIAMFMSLYDCDVILIEKGDDIASHELALFQEMLNADLH